ncbi:ubiquinol oxidase subunit II [Limoniibacter endophyticus]|uniref:Ubiquinol oxidase polypeptide II n=1 Tax=Limoniibacter endophyticus TaxID=1565040 RepID=A0A8J3DLR2_9HYPH|nr:ubiquinol oxidase subunit II [Limoniibacter endophyticus]GHC81262.1 cytochrome ubiquinol oxidase subunit II [Limoniibacter endophyticus]
MPRFILRSIFAMPFLFLLSGCNWVVMAPSGDIANQQRDLIITSTLLMLLIIVPVIIATLFFAWKYRASNTEARYDPEWHHSTRLEVMIWAAPLAIIIALGAITWVSTHKLDPYRPLERLDAERVIPEGVTPLEVEVVALDWKWLFFYPQYGVATVNELAAPVDRPINFKLTSSSVMNSFYVPALAGQIYAMPGMQTRLHAVINEEGVYDGFSANFSGDGFSHMRFKFHGVSEDGFNQWVAKVKSEGGALRRPDYVELEKPSEREPVRYYASYENGLYEAILNLCVDANMMCANEMMHIDLMGGAGVESHENLERLRYDNRDRAGEAAPGATFPATGEPARSQEAPQGHEGQQPDTGGAPQEQHEPEQGAEPAPSESAPQGQAPEDESDGTTAPTQLNN